MTFKIGDSVKIIKRLPDNITGTEEWKKPNGDVGKTGKIRSIVDSNRFEVTDGAIYYGHFTNKELELLEQSKSLVGRYLKALVDRPQATSRKRGDYAEIVGKLAENQYNLKGGYIYYTDKHNPEHWELMPEGFKPDSIKSTYQCNPIPKDATKIRVIKDIHKRNISCAGSLPNLIPEGSIMWERNTSYISAIKTKSGDICPENNRYGANIPAHYFEIIEEPIVEESKSQFEVGKWYKYTGEHLSDGSYYAKYLKTDSDNKFHYSERIFNKEYANKTDWSSSNYNPVLLTDLSEMQDLLPSGHLDKIIPKIMVTEVISTPEVKSKVMDNTIEVGDYVELIKRGAVEHEMKDYSAQLQLNTPYKVVHKGNHNIGGPKITCIKVEGDPNNYYIPIVKFKKVVTSNKVEDIKHSVQAELYQELTKELYPVTPEQCYQGIKLNSKESNNKLNTSVKGTYVVIPQIKVKKSKFKF